MDVSWNNVAKPIINHPFKGRVPYHLYIYILIVIDLCWFNSGDGFWHCFTHMKNPIEKLGGIPMTPLFVVQNGSESPIFHGRSRWGSRCSDVPISRSMGYVRIKHGNHMAFVNRSCDIIKMLQIKPFIEIWIWNDLIVKWSLWLMIVIDGDEWWLVVTNAQWVDNGHSWIFPFGNQTSHGDLIIVDFWWMVIHGD